MKKILLLSLSLIIIFCGCVDVDSNSKNQSVSINVPEDEKVNGYRDDDYISSNKIGWDNIDFSDKIDTTGLYWGNKNSKKLHLTTCQSTAKTKDENKVYYNTKEEFLDRGYTPCKICNP
jgi:hypothetical protein